MTAAIMGERVRLEVADSVAILTLQRPEKRNAIDLGMLAALDAACDRIDGDGDIRVAVLTGSAKDFSAGGDVGDWGRMAPEEFGWKWIRLGNRVFDRLAGLRVPLIAALTGAVFGGGLELAACADIRVADVGATFGLPEPGLGIIPGWSGTQRLVRRFGQQPIRRMVLGAEILHADEAWRLGLVDQVVPAGETFAAVQLQAARIAARSPVATSIAKLMISASGDDDAGAAVDTLAGILAAKSGDGQDGVAAFLNKRPPSFKGNW
jgi:enoyl-CoA hydratase/carnithine racemase